VACATLTYLAEPADPALGGLLQVLSPVEVLAAVGHHPRPRNQSHESGPRRPALDGYCFRWRDKGAVQGWPQE